MSIYNDMSKYIKTGPLLKSSWLLASDNVGVIVTTTKPSIRTLFAFGCFGRLHNIIFDMDCEKLYSDLYGIYPYCKINGQTLYPFKNGFDFRSKESYDIADCGTVSFSEEDNALTIRNIPMYRELSTEIEAILPEITICVINNQVRIRSTFPENAEECSIHLPWYPLYDMYSANGEKQLIQYYIHGYHTTTGMISDISDDIILEDQLSRQASVKISASSGFLRLHGRTLPDKNNAYFLSTDAISTSKQLDVTLEVISPEVSVIGNHYYRCGETAEITVIKNGKHENRTFCVPNVNGIQEFKLDDIHSFSYCAVPDNSIMMKKAADAVLAIMWKEGSLAGVPPSAFDPVLLKPVTRSTMHYCSHGMRTLSILCAEGIHQNDISYINAAANAVSRVAQNSYHFENGAIFTPLLMHMDGSVDEYAGACRPSDSGIIIRSLIHIVKGYLHFNQIDKAKEYICLAKNYSQILCMMQNEDGSFCDRYSYPSLKPSQRGTGTVNNWCLQLWKLIPLLRHFGMDEDANKIYELISKYITYQIDKDASILKISGGGEDASDFGDALNTDATLFIIKYLISGETIWREYAEQALKKSWLMSCMWADMPQFFCLHGNSELGCYYDQPMGLFSAGGMHDLTAVEANLFANEILDSEFAFDMAEALHNARLGSFIRDNGGMYMVILQCPNYYHRDERHSESLMYGGVGVYDWYEAEKSSPALKDTFYKKKDIH